MPNLEANSRFKDEFRTQQLVERQLASACARVLVPRMNENQRETIVEMHKAVTQAQHNFRSMMDDLVDSLVRRGF